MENQTPDARAKPLTLTDMTSCFIILGLGLSLSFFVFLLENIFKRINYHYCFRKQNGTQIRVLPAYELAY